jgi:hypothetical protein
MQPHPLNAPGDFFVQDGCCMSCLVPVEDAPHLLTYDKDAQHCYVHRQPTTKAETEQMVTAMRQSEVRCIYYRGKDEQIIAVLKSKGEADQCV